MEPLVWLDDVSLNLGKTFSLANLSFGVEEGEIFGFLGPSGAGKTTTIKLLTKQLQKERGRICLFGKEIEKVSRTIYDDIGILSDTSNLYERMSIRKNLDFFAAIRNVGKKEVDEILEKVKLKGDEKKQFKKCSKGMKQRAILASAVLHKPKLLFLDEPCSGLDPATTHEVHKLFRELNAGGTTIFLTTHNMEEADSLCNRIAILNQGQIVECGDPQELKLKYAKNRIRILTTDREEIIVDKNEAGAKQIEQLISAGKCLSIHSEEPNLEQIFLELTGRELV